MPASKRTAVSVENSERTGIEFTLIQDDIKTVEVDVAAIKYSRDFWKIDPTVTALVKGTKRNLRVDEYVYIPTKDKIGSPHALFVGVPSVKSFGYADARKFASRAVEVLAAEDGEARSLAMTITGISGGMDEVETAMAMFRGIADSARAGRIPPALESVTIVDPDRRRVARLRKAFDQAFQMIDYVTPLPVRRWGYQVSVGTPRSESARAIKRLVENDVATTEAKPHVFVAMPFKTEMEDLFIYGIQASVHKIHYLCERIDQESFTGDIVERMKLRIETAALVIADLTKDNPNVFLEVGYAWGKTRPTLLLAKESQKLRFDVQGYRFIKYTNIHDLAQKLSKMLRGLKSDGAI